MEYALIKLEAIPELYFAHSFSTEKYNMNFLPSSSIIEITIIEKGDIVRKNSNGISIFVPAGSVHIRLENFLGSMSAVSVGLHSHSTVCIRMPYSCSPLSEEQILPVCRKIEEGKSSPFELVLPIFLPLGKYSTVIEKQIQSIIQAKMTKQTGSDLQIAGLALELLATLSRDCINDILYAQQSINISPSSIVYCKRATDFIAVHYSSKLSVADIAFPLGITPNYLSNIFKASMGKSVMQYVTEVRLNIVKELLANNKATLAEAGRLVGIEDANYLSRLFHKYYGSSARKMLKSK